jgi:predicted RNase H-like nuclease
MTQHVGVDGCKAGWFAVTRDGTGLAWRLFSTVAELACAFSGAESILIDVPIGLPWAETPIRPCDRLASRGNLASLAGAPSHDLVGLPIEMVYLRM